MHADHNAMHNNVKLTSIINPFVLIMLEVDQPLAWYNKTTLYIPRSIQSLVAFLPAVPGFSCSGSRNPPEVKLPFII